MKAIIVKNDDFETVGFEVQTREGNTFYRWGISPHSMVFTKQIDADRYMMDIHELIQLEKELQMLDSFVSTFFDIAKANDLLKKGKGVKMQVLDEKKEQVKKRINQIISKF